MGRLEEEHATAAAKTRRAAGEAVPIVFGADQALFGVLSLAKQDLARNLGVVVCAPLGLENSFSYRPLRTLAGRIAERGVPVLRFDWYGSGDSGEPPSSTAGTDLWREAIRNAIDAIRSETGVDQVALLGLRIGATLALLEAADNPVVSTLALLSPYSKGRTYLRELRALEALLDPAGASDPAAHGTHLPPGSMAAGGFLLPAAQVQVLNGIDLGTHLLTASTSRRTLIATVEPDRSGAVLAKRLTDAGWPVTSASDRELSCLWGGATWSFLPPSCRKLLVDWLLEGAEPKSQPIVRSDRGSATLSPAAGAFREQATTFKTNRGRRFAVTCSPTGTETASEDWIVFLNAGPLRRSGTSRLATDWARRWAPAGVNSLRFDLGGVGDSDGDTMGDEIYIDDPALAFRPEFLLDIRDALEWLEEHHGARRFVLVGLCSGGTLAYEAARTDPRVAGIAIMNAPTLFIDRRALSLIAWGEARRVVRGPRSLLSFVQARRPRWALKALRGALLTIGHRTHPALFRRAILDSLARLRGANTRIAAVYAGGDSGLGFLERSLGPDYRSQLASFDVNIDVIEGPDHVFTQLWSHELLTEVCERVLISVGFLKPTAERMQLGAAHDSAAASEG